MSDVKYIGRRVAVGIGKEGTRGTAVSATYWEKQSALTLDEKVDHVLDPSAFGTIEDAQDSKIVNKWVEGEIDAQVKGTSFGLWLLALMGTDTATAQSSPNGAVYDHVFTVSNSNQHASLTINVADPVQGYQYANSVVTGMDINCEVGKYVDFKVKFMGLAGSTASPSASFTSENYFLPQYGTFKKATTVAGLSGASAIAIKRFSLSVNKNVERDAVIGSLSPADFLNKHFEVTGEIEAIFQNESDFKTAFLADTAQSLLLDIQNSDVTIGSSAHPRIQFQVSRSKLTDLGRTQGPNDLVLQKVAFKGLYDATTSSMLKITLSNLVSSAY